MQEISVHLLPELTTPAALRDAVAVVIDVLRASTTIIEALAVGAREVIPCLEIDEARTLAAQFPRDQVVLGGERGGLPIEGFDLGNSPAQCTAASVGGKTLVFTTTNGTKALHACREARRVLVGVPVNLAVLCAKLVGEQRVHLMCAGSDGHVTRDDVLGAGAIVAGLARTATDAPHLNDEARLALEAWCGVTAGAATDGEPISVRLARELRATRSGRNLIAIGQGSDLELAAAIDRHRIVPQLDVARWRIGLP